MSSQQSRSVYPSNGQRRNLISRKLQSGLGGGSSTGRVCVTVCVSESVCERKCVCEAIERSTPAVILWKPCPSAGRSMLVCPTGGGGQLQFISGDLTSCQDSGSLPPNAISNHVLKMISIYQSAHPSIHPVLVSGQVMFCTSSWGSRLSKASLDPSFGALISSQEKPLIEGNL